LSRSTAPISPKQSRKVSMQKAHGTERMIDVSERIRTKKVESRASSTTIPLNDCFLCACVSSTAMGVAPDTGNHLVIPVTPVAHKHGCSPCGPPLHAVLVWLIKVLPLPLGHTETKTSLGLGKDGLLTPIPAAESSTYQTLSVSESVTGYQGEGGWVTTKKK